MNNVIPKNTRELYFFVHGEFKSLNAKLDDIKKTTFWIGGLAGTVFGAMIIGIFKIIKWIR